MYSYDHNKYIIIWLILILIIVVVVIIIIILHLRKYALFQCTRDNIWYPKDEPNFTNRYLVINDPNRKAFTNDEIKKIEQSKMLNLSTLQYINIWKFENFPGNKIILYFHGNNNNISYREYVVKICKHLKLNLMLVDYRGYGDSSGSPESDLLLKDAETAYQYLNDHYVSENIIIWGESLGGIAAIWTAHKYKVSALILLSTFADIKTVIKNAGVGDNIANFIKNISRPQYMNNGTWIKDVDCPTVILHSPNDDLLPYVNSQMLYDNVGSDKKLLININGTHSHPYFTYDNIYDLLSFLEISDRDVISRPSIIKTISIMNSL